MRGILYSVELPPRPDELTVAEARTVYLAQQEGYRLAESMRLASLSEVDLREAVRAFDGLYERAYASLPIPKTSGLQEFYRLLGKTTQ